MSWLKTIYIFMVASSLVSSALAADPTRPPGFGNARIAKTQYHLNSVLLSDTRKVATINGRALSVGETINGATVLSITHTLVRLDKNGRIIELKPKRASIRQEK
ncbi:hypothetical protein NO559_09695 [Dasania sp. GY-MA-18]|uniref:MSHA biogenesis protein MshK n=1 Tax=Dasania phycosphaerae TaxID=2950436 RepID=A0A9J6RN95_9GAMM|nr:MULTISPECIES: hypothetical protein [Dasania]MCR8923046.1 hypothetical protein [Dasania sp. GY-MA-18]MCZ0865477.1 hypothetical protein [Dasania phycosphaerae]MCZ0869202.1 hypothetical protein [Dasania phycosphaerae]